MRTAETRRRARAPFSDGRWRTFLIRQACGGHGYLLSSGLPEFELSYLANCTLEGDNYLIGQQTTRFLFKMLDQARSREITRDLTKPREIWRDLTRSDAI